MSNKCELKLSLIKSAVENIDDQHRYINIPQQGVSIWKYKQHMFAKCGIRGAVLNPECDDGMIECCAMHGLINNYHLHLECLWGFARNTPSCHCHQFTNEPTTYLQKNNTCLMYKLNRNAQFIAKSFQEMAFWSLHLSIGASGGGRSMHLKQSNQFCL